MNVKKLLTELKYKDIEISVKEDELSINAPKGAITPELKEHIRAHKSAIMDLFKSAKTKQLPLKKILRNNPAPVSETQYGLWFINKFQDGKDTQYNIPWAYRLKGSLDILALEKALNTIIQRHETLRTSFPEIDGKPVQKIIDELQVIIQPICITESHIPSYIDNHATHIFDLTQGPLIKIDLLRLSQKEHILLINMHHIISDGWSIGILNRELTMLYGAYIKGESFPLPPLPIQYADFTGWQNQRLRGEFLEQEVGYWKNQLANAPALLELPTDRPRPARRNFQGKLAKFLIPNVLTKQLNRLTQQENVSLFVVLMATFQLLLYHYSGQTDICVGTPFANRQREELEGIIGLILNIIVLRCRINAKSNFKEFLQQVNSTTLAAQDHQDIPFERLVEALQPNRSTSYPPLFQVIMVLQSTPEKDLELPHLTVSAIESHTHTAKYDLTMDLTESPEGIRGKLEYNTDLFNQNTMEQFCRHYQTLLQEVVTNPDRIVSKIPLITKAEQQLLLDWNSNNTIHRQNQCIHQLFDIQAKNTPDATAIIFEKEQLTYRKLNERSNQLAHYLIERNVGQEVRVGLCINRSLDMVIGILGILKAGGAYVPIDPNNPIARIKYILEDSSIALLLTQTDLQKKILGLKGFASVCLDQDWSEIEKADSKNPLISSTLENLAYVIYTSGSTGKPKGTLITHANVARLFSVTQEQYQFNYLDVWVMFHSFAFDFSVWELWGALCYGGKVIVIPYWMSRDSESFCQLVYEQGVTVLNQTPSAFSQFIAADLTLNFHSERLKLRYVIFGGEALDTKSLEPWFERHGDRQPQLINMYGITETTVHVTYYPINQKDPELQSSVIGKPLADLQAYILDEHLQVIPIGIPGELYVGGGGVARGYHNRADLTAERFIPHPFSKVSDARLYKTGDLVRYLPNGVMEYLGRIDQQVNIRGFRIELGELQHILTEQPMVMEAVVLAQAINQGSGGHYLVAYVVINEGTDPELEELRNSLKAVLPDYMMPSFFVFLDQLPLTENGKVDRKALPVPDAESLVTQEYVAPGTESETVLVNIWANVLNLPAGKIGIEDNFFELGGHSLLATSVVSRIREIFEIKIQIRELFTSNTIEKLAQAIDKQINNRQLTESLMDKDALSDITDIEEVKI